MCWRHHGPCLTKCKLGEMQGSDLCLTGPHVYHATYKSRLYLSPLNTNYPDDINSLQSVSRSIKMSSPARHILNISTWSISSLYLCVLHFLPVFCSVSCTIYSGNVNSWTVFESSSYLLITLFCYVFISNNMWRL